MMEMSIKSILKDLSVNAEVDHVDLGSAKGTPSDIYVGTRDILINMAKNIINAISLPKLFMSLLVLSVVNLVIKSIQQKR